MTVIPPYLKPGDRIWIVAPAGKINRETVVPGIELLRDHGYEVMLGDHIFSHHFQYAGTDPQRASDLQKAINDPQAKAIICARGGYGTIRIIERIDFSPLLKSPKWLVGFSDITVLHSVFNKLRIASIHGAMPGFYLDNNKPSPSYFSLCQTLENGHSPIEFAPHELNRPGLCSGELVGGNLSLLYSLQGTPWQLETDGKILFIEDLAEYLYHLDRMMNNFRLSGKLENLAGLVVGGFTEMKDNDNPYGKTAYEIIYEAVEKYNYPVYFNIPSGHIRKNLSMVFGVKYSLVPGEKCKLTRS